MNEDDPFRFCIYCLADCHEPDATHREDCPSNTGLYPVTQAELEPHGMVCMDCEHVFELGEFYVERDIANRVVEVICVGCGALDAVRNG